MKPTRSRKRDRLAGRAVLELGGSPIDLDTHRTAKVLLNRYGDAASLHAASRADEMVAAGDMDGRAVWLRIQEAVLELLKEAPGEGERVQ